MICFYSEFKVKAENLINLYVHVCRLKQLKLIALKKFFANLTFINFQDFKDICSRHSPIVTVISFLKVSLAESPVLNDHNYVPFAFFSLVS